MWELVGDRSGLLIRVPSHRLANRAKFNARKERVELILRAVSKQSHSVKGFFLVIDLETGKDGIGLVGEVTALCLAWGKAAPGSDFCPVPVNGSCKRVVTHEQPIPEQLSLPQGW